MDIRREQADRTLVVSVTKRVELVGHELVIYDGLSETRLPVSSIENVSVRLFAVTIATTMRTYEFEAAAPC